MLAHPPKKMKESKWISGTLSKEKLQLKDQKQNKSESFGKCQALIDLKMLTVPEYPSVSEHDHAAQCTAYHERQRRVSWQMSFSEKRICGEVDKIKHKM